MIKDCVCPSKFQDREHGPGKRVFNKGNSGAKCTVCGKSSLTVDKKGKK